MTTSISIKKKGGFYKYPFLVLLILQAFACKKETELGLEVLPEEEQLGIAVDSFAVSAYTVNHDSLDTDKRLTLLAGAYIDPIFGKVNATLYTQLLPEDPGLNFSGFDIQFDSAVLAFRYDVSLSGVYGKNIASGGSFDPLTLSVHELTEDIIDSIEYYNNSSLSYQSTPIGELNGYVPDFSDSVTLDDGREPAQVRIKVDSAWAASLLFSNEITDATSFKNYMKGVAIVTNDANLSSEEGNILYLNPYSTYTRLEFYYRKKETNQPDSTFAPERFRLIIDETTGRFNSYNIENTGTDAGLALSDTNTGKSTLYVQGLGGPHVYVKCHGYLDYFMDNPAILNLAELILPVQDTAPEFALSPNLFIQKLNESGGKTVVLDQLEGTGHVDGYYDSDKKQYRIVLTRQMHTFIEAYKNGELTDFGFEIGPTNERTFANRTVLNGSDPMDGRKVKFRFVYTPL